MFLISINEVQCVSWGEIRGGGGWSLSGEETHPSEREQYVQRGGALRWPGIWKI